MYLPGTKEMLFHIRAAGKVKFKFKGVTEKCRKYYQGKFFLYVPEYLSCTCGIQNVQIEMTLKGEGLVFGI